MRRNWGALVAAEFVTLVPLVVAGCAEAPPPEPVAPPRAQPSAVAAPRPTKRAPDFSDPSGAKPGLGAFVPIVPPTSASEVVAPQDQGQVVAFGKGVMQLVELRSPFENGACLVPVAEGKSCFFLRFAPWKQARDRAGWERPARDNEVAAWGAFLPAGGEWGNLSPGADRVYALRRDSGMAIDAIDEKGNVTPVFDGEGTPPVYDVRLVETATGLLAIGVDGDTQGLSAIPLHKKDGGGMTAGAATPLRVVMTGDTGTAQDARWMIEKKQRVGYGTWDVLEGIDDKGNADKIVYMAWTEATPPAKYAPRGGGSKKGGHGGTAKHGCGGRPSRPLSDPSVEKKTHLTILGDDGRVVADHVVPLALPADAPPQLSLAAVPGGVEINGVRFGKDGRPKDVAAKPVAAEVPLAPPPLLGPVLQRLDAAAFDAASGEGIVIYSEKDDQRAVRFDARGVPVGAPIDITNRLRLDTRPLARLAHAGDTWVALEQGGDAVVVIDGPNAGKRIAIASDRSWLLPKGEAWVFPVDETHVEVVRFVPLPKTYLLEIGVGDPALSRGLMLSTVDVASGNSTPWSLANGWFAGEAVTPRLNEVSIAARGKDGSLVLVGHGSEGSWRQVRRNADGGWAAPVLIGEGSHVQHATAHHVWGDVVAVLSGNSPLATWLDGARTIQLDAVAHDPPLRGPLVGAGAFALTAAPGSPIKLPPEVVKLAQVCPLAFATGPSRTVMVCDEAVDPTRVSARVGLRVVRY